MMKPCRHLSPLKPSEFQPMRLEQLFVVTRDPPSGTTKEIERHRTTFAPRQPTWHVTTFAELLNAAHCHWSCGGRLENKKLQEMAVIGFHIKNKRIWESEIPLFSFFLTPPSSNQPFCFKNSESAPAAAHCLRLPAKHQRWINRNDPNPNQMFLKFCISKPTA